MDEHPTPSVFDRFPTRFLTVAVLLTTAVLCWLGWSTYKSYQLTRLVRERHFQIQELQGLIVHLDEVLTMSARMAAATGDLAWEQRYLHFEPMLDDAIKKVIKLVPNAYRGVGATETNEANLKLVEMEHRAFDLVRQNRRTDAVNLLFSSEYEAQKQVYSEGMTKVAGLLKEDTIELLESEQRRTFLNSIFVVVVLPTLMIGWLVAMRLLQRWRLRLSENNRRLNQQGQELFDLNASLDKRVMERTQEVEDLHLASLKQKEILQRIFDSIPVMVALYEGAGKVKIVNRELEHVLGWSPEELHDIRQLVDSCLDEACRSPFSTHLQDAPGGWYDVSIRARDGRVLNTSWSGVRLSDGSIIAIGQDISDRKRAEEALRESSQRLETLVKFSPLAIISMDRHAIVTEWNPAAERMHGWKREELIGRPIPIIPEDQQQNFQENIEALSQGNARTGLELEQCRKDGSRYAASVSVAPLYDKDGKPSGSMRIIENISQRKHADEERLKAKEAAEASNRAKSEFLANMSHEIRTPMNGIIGITDLVLDTELTSEQSEYLHMVKGSADALLAVLNDILDFSKVEAGKLELDCVNFNLRKSLGEVVKTLAIKSHQKGLEFIFDVRPEVPTTVIGDPSRLRQVLVNLVGNSIKFTQRGEVEVNVRTGSQSAEGTILLFSVRDTGIGIPTDKRKKIFDAFSQADSSTTRAYGGTGLGLAISAQLVGLMGGRIWIESEVGKGSTFYFTVRVGTEVAALPYESLDVSQLAGVPVLVVDDNATNRRIIEDSVIRWKMKSTVVEGAVAAIQALRHAHASGAQLPLVLTDAHMPEIDGFGLVERIRQDPLLGNVRIVVLTSAGERGDAARCQKLGVAAYLSKPFERLELRELLLSVLAKDPAKSEKRAVVTRHTIREQEKSLSFLVAEDNPVNQRLIASLLGKRGHNVVLAQNGREALEALEKQSFDVVLMDGQMPEMDGFEATKLIREKEKLSGIHLPIIALTALAMQGDKERCLACGMDGYVVKPVKLEELFSVIKNVVPAITGRADAKDPPQRAESTLVTSVPCLGNGSEK